MPPFTLYTIGSISLGRNPADITQDLTVAHLAMEVSVWFHSSPTYNNGFTFMVLRHAFEADRARVPRMVIKVRDASVTLMRFEVEDSCRRLGLDAIDVAQLVSMDPNPGNLVDQLQQGGGPLMDELASLRAWGLIRQAVIFIHQTQLRCSGEGGQEQIDRRRDPVLGVSQPGSESAGVSS